MHFLSGPPSLGAVDMDYVYKQIEERARKQGFQIKAKADPALDEAKLLARKQAQDERARQLLLYTLRRAEEERRKRNLLIIGGLAAASALFFSMRG